MNRDWLVPILRQLVAGIVAILAAWLVKSFGVEITSENREFLTGTLTTLGAALIGMIWVSVSKWMKPWFLRVYHPGTTTVRIEDLGSTTVGDEVSSLAKITKVG